MNLDDFFDRSDGPIRDKHDRPLLIPRGGTHEDRRWYTRASGLGEFLEDNSFLKKWEMRYLAIGLSRRMDLVRLAAAEVYTTGFGKGDESENRSSGKRVDDIIRRALDSQGIHEKADYGTAVHARTEPGNQGVDPDEMQATEVQSFWDILAESGIQILDTEFFMANDEIWTAGTCDHLVYVPKYGICIGDKKTSSKASKQYDVQFATYAWADRYDYTNDQRQTLEEFVESIGWNPELINRDVGLIFWIKNGKTQIRELDLKEGWKAAKTAAWIRDVHQTKGVAKDVTKDLVADAKMRRANLLAALRVADSEELMRSFWDDPEFRAIWTDEHTAAVNERRAELA